MTMTTLSRGEPRPPSVTEGCRGQFFLPHRRAARADHLSGHGTFGPVVRSARFGGRSAGWAHRAAMVLPEVPCRCPNRCAAVTADGRGRSAADMRYALEGPGTARHRLGRGKAHSGRPDDQLIVACPSPRDAEGVEPSWRLHPFGVGGHQGPTMRARATVISPAPDRRGPSDGVGFRFSGAGWGAGPCRGPASAADAAGRAR